MKPEVDELKKYKEKKDYTVNDIGSLKQEIEEMKAKKASLQKEIEAQRALEEKLEYKIQHDMMADEHRAQLKKEKEED